MKTAIHNLSFKGISGIIFGIISIFFVTLLNQLINNYSLGGLSVSMLPISFFEIFITIVIFLYVVISFFTVTIINKKRRKKIGIKGWDKSAKKMSLYLLSFLITGVILSYEFISKGNLKFIIPMALFLIGILSLIVVKFSNSKLKIIGILFLLSGILAFLFPEFMFYILGISLGLYPIIYGIYTFKKG